MWNLPVALEFETPRWAITFREDLPADFDVSDVPSPGRCPHLTFTFYPAGAESNTFFATISGNTWPLRHGLPQWELSRGEKRAAGFVQALSSMPTPPLPWMNCMAASLAATIACPSLQGSAPTSAQPSRRSSALSEPYVAGKEAPLPTYLFQYHGRTCFPLILAVCHCSPDSIHIHMFHFVHLLACPRCLGQQFLFLIMCAVSCRCLHTTDEHTMCPSRPSTKMRAANTAQ